MNTAVEIQAYIHADTDMHACTHIWLKLATTCIHALLTCIAIATAVYIWATTQLYVDICWSIKQLS